MKPLRVAHIPVYRTAPIKIPEELIKTLPNKVALFMPAQWMNQYDTVKEQLEQAQKEVLVLKPRHTTTPGQILGCSTQTWKEPQAFLYVGEGEFHPRAIIYKNKQPVYRLDPLLNKWDVYAQEEVKQILQRHKGAMIHFLHANTVGVLTTTKSGQKDLEAIKQLRKQYPEKTFIHFLVNTIDWEGLNDFPFIQCWINTGCPRIGLDDQNKVDKPIINAEHALEGTHSF